MAVGACKPVHYAHQSTQAVVQRVTPLRLLDDCPYLRHVR